MWVLWPRSTSVPGFVAVSWFAIELTCRQIHRQIQTQTHKCTDHPRRTQLRRTVWVQLRRDWDSTDARKSRGGRIAVVTGALRNSRETDENCVRQTYKNSLSDVEQATDRRRALDYVDELMNAVDVWTTRHPTTERLTELHRVLFGASHTSHVLDSP